MKAETKFISPYGGELVDLFVRDDDRGELTEYANRLPSIQLTARGICDLEMLAGGAFSPLRTFMGRADFNRVKSEMRLESGLVFPIPVTLPVEPFEGLRLDGDIALRDSRNDIMALLTVEEIFEWSRDDLSEAVLGTNDLHHPLVTEIRRWGKLNISGRLQVLNLPNQPDFKDLRLSPSQTRERLAELKNGSVVAFQTRNPIHRAHEEITKRAAEATGSTLLIHPVVGMTKPGDVDYFTRVRSYRALVKNYYDPDKTLLSILPLAMRMAGPREALWHAIIRRNYGANHFIVGRDHASPGLDSKGNPFYDSDAARNLVEAYADEIGVGVVSFEEMLYLPDEDRFEERSRIEKNTTTISLSGTEIRENFLQKGKSLPGWFTRPETAQILAESYPPLALQGVCLWFTGLSGAGKSTTSEILTSLLLEHGRRVTVLDGDVVRTHLSKGLGFSKEDRDANILRIGFVASEIVRHHGTVICAAVSPYRATRNEVRNLIGEANFVEIFVDTPLDVCERRDTKGMYAKARRGEIKDFTGVDDIYEVPETADITIETVSTSAFDNASRILDFLKDKGYLQQSASL